MSETAVAPEISVGVRSLLARVEKYATEMAPGKRLTDDQINVQQKNFYLTIQSILTQEEHRDFVAAFNGTIDLFNKYSEGALSAMLVSRNFYSVRLDSVQRRDFSSWVNIFIVMSKPRLRRNMLKQIDLIKAYRSLSEMHSARAREHIQALCAVDAQ